MIKVNQKIDIFKNIKNCVNEKKVKVLEINYNGYEIMLFIDIIENTIYRISCDIYINFETKYSKHRVYIGGNSVEEKEDYKYVKETFLELIKETIEECVESNA